MTTLRAPFVNEQTEMMTGDARSTCARLPGLAWFVGVRARCPAPNRSVRPGGSVYERFTSIAVSLEEGSGEHGYRVRRPRSACSPLTMAAMQAEIEAARQAGLLHDLGKLCVPPTVLVKEDALDEFEACVFREHPMHGRPCCRTPAARARAGCRSPPP